MVEIAKPSKTVSSVPILIIVALLVLVVIGVLVWALYNYQAILNRSESLSQNPYCFRAVCSDPETQPVLTDLTSKEDPQRTAFSNLNFCLVNAVPASITEALQTCAIGSSPVPAELEQSLADFAAFYNNDYIPTCGYTWKSAPVPVSNTGDQEAINDPNNPVNPNGYELNGVNDNTIVYLVACADNIGLQDPNIEALRSQCGELCRQV
jgi:hypothetical protein